MSEYIFFFFKVFVQKHSKTKTFLFAQETNEDKMLEMLFNQNELLISQSQIKKHLIPDNETASFNLEKYRLLKNETFDYKYEPISNNTPITEYIEVYRMKTSHSL
jgi:hypothetical protein